MTGWSSILSKINPFNITVIQVYAPTTDSKEDEIKQSYKDLQDLLEITPKTDALFIIGDWNARVGNQEIPEVIDKFGFWSTNETGQSLWEFCQASTTVITSTFFKQCKRWLYIWAWPDGLCQNQINFILCSRMWRCSISQQNQDWELTVAQIMSSFLQIQT